MSAILFRDLRRALALAGGEPALSVPDGVTGRVDQPRLSPARLVEPMFRAIDPGPPLRRVEPLAFLDGIQHTGLIGYVDSMPVLGARVAAGVRLREERRTRGVVELRTDLAVGRAAALQRLDRIAAGVRTIALDDDSATHPIGDMDLARAAVDRARAELEHRAAAEWRKLSPVGMLLIDGSITVHRDWATDHHMIGVIKSHSIMPFDGDDAQLYLSLPPGHRTAVFSPASRHVEPVHSFALRLHRWRGINPFHGLIRVEYAAREDVTAHADALARWLLAERAPLADDPRWDRLLYGVHDVERWLRARAS